MKIAGWQRIAIFGSILWIFGAGIYQHFEDFESARSQAFEYGEDCKYFLKAITNDTIANQKNFLKCDDTRSEFQKMLMKNDIRNMALLAFLPVFFVWLFAFWSLAFGLSFIGRLVQ